MLDCDADRPLGSNDDIGQRRHKTLLYQFSKYLSSKHEDLDPIALNVF